jgi:hypothetical protein
MSMARIKKMVTFAIDPDLLRRLGVWISAQEVAPSKTAVFEAALREWLDAREKKGRR